MFSPVHGISVGSDGWLEPPATRASAFRHAQPGRRLTLGSQTSTGCPRTRNFRAAGKGDQHGEALDLARLDWILNSSVLAGIPAYEELLTRDPQLFSRLEIEEIAAFLRRGDVDTTDRVPPRLTRPPDAPLLVDCDHGNDPLRQPQPAPQSTLYRQFTGQ